MFKIPNWEDDVPKSKVDFGKSTKTKNKKEPISESPQKQNKQKNNNLPEKVSKFKAKKFKQSGNNDQSHANANRQKQFKKSFNNNERLANGDNKVNNSNFHKKDKNNKQVRDNSKKENNNLSDHKSKPSNGIGNNIVSSKKKKTKKRKLDEVGTSDSSNQVHNKKPIDSESTTPSKPKKKKPNDEETVQEGSILLPQTKKKKKKIVQSQLENEKEINHPSKVDQKKAKLREMLQLDSNRSKINVSGNNLRQRMMERLKSAQFRFLNEKLYTSSGSEAQKLFQSDPEAFNTYHEGYQQQVKKWPVNPLDLIVKRISKMPKTHTIADMGCGEAALSRRVSQATRSFDLVARPGVEACDMAHTPLLAQSVDVAVYCLALMGTDLAQYLVEANRVLKVGGHLLIAEVESRFDKVENFVEGVQRLGFKLKNLDKSHQVFFFLEFVKVRDPPAKKSKMPVITLKPCLYKRR